MIIKKEDILNISFISARMFLILLFVFILFGNVEKTQAIIETTVVVDDQCVTNYSVDEDVLNLRLASTNSLDPNMSYYYCFLVQAVEKSKKL